MKDLDNLIDAATDALKAYAATAQGVALMQRTQGGCDCNQNGCGDTRIKGKLDRRTLETGECAGLADNRVRIDECATGGAGCFVAGTINTPIKEQTPELVAAITGKPRDAAIRALIAIRDAAQMAITRARDGHDGDKKVDADWLISRCEEGLRK